MAAYIVQHWRVSSVQLLVSWKKHKLGIAISFEADFQFLKHQGLTSRNWCFKPDFSSDSYSSRLELLHLILVVILAALQRKKACMSWRDS